LRELRRERQGRPLVIKGELSSVNVKLRKTRLGELDSDFLIRINNYVISMIIGMYDLCVICDFI